MIAGNLTDWDPPPQSYQRVRKRAKQRPTELLKRKDQVPYTSLLVSIARPKSDRWRGSILEGQLIEKLGLEPREEFEAERCE